MAKEKKIKYQDFSETDLLNRITEAGVELHSARQKLRIGQFKKVSELGRLRKEIARAKTEVRARQLKTEAKG